MRFIKTYFEKRKRNKLLKQLKSVNICNQGVRDTRIIASTYVDELMLHTLIEKTKELNGGKSPTKH